MFMEFGESFAHENDRINFPDVKHDGGAFVTRKSTA